MVDPVVALLAAGGGLSGVVALIRMLRYDPQAARLADRNERREMQSRIDELYSQVSDYRRRETDLNRRISDLEREVFYWKQRAGA